MAAKRLLRRLQDPRLLPRFFCVMTYVKVSVKVSVKERWPKQGPILVDDGAQSYEIH